MNTQVTDNGEGLMPSKLIAQQNRLVEEIFQHKSDINNITLQLDRDDPNDESRREWRSGAKYAKAMKEAELSQLEEHLDGTKAAIQIAISTLTSGDRSGFSLGDEYMAAAKRRLTSDVHDSILEEAQEVLQDALYDAANCTHQP